MTTTTNCPHCGAARKQDSSVDDDETVFVCGTYSDGIADVFHRSNKDCYERQLAAKDEQLKKFGDLENQLESYKAQWKKHYAQASAIKLQRECMDVFDMSHKLAKHLGLDEYTPQTVADVVIGVLAAKDRELVELRSWKAQALAVEPPLQEIGHEIGVGLGQSVYDKILPWIVETKRELNAVQARVKEMECAAVLQMLQSDKACDQLRTINAELLEALRGLLEEYDDRKCQWGSTYLWEKHEDAEVIEKARAVIARAAENDTQP